MLLKNIGKIRLLYLASNQITIYYLIKMPKETRKSYPASLKLDAIDYAKTTNNCVAAQMFGVDHTQIGRWRMKEEDLRKASRKNRRVGSGALPTYEITEESLKKWILDQCKRGICNAL